MRRWHLLLASLLAALVLGACTSIGRVQGEQVVNGKLAVNVSGIWNRVESPWDDEPYETWTQEGIPLDHLRLWAGVKPGQALMAKPMVFFRGADEKDARVPTFRAGLPPDRLVSLFETLYASAGAVRVTRIDPAPFAGEQGVRFEFTLMRRADDLPMQGVGWAAVHGGELYAATFVAPRLSFFQRLAPMAESVVKTARVRG
jgi:hypothetical protein